MTPSAPSVTVLYPGSFDPLHKGHKALAEYALSRSEAAELWIMPTPDNPLKEQAPLFSYACRCGMAQEVFRGNPRVQLCTIEKQLPAPYYTVQTLSALRCLYPQKNFVLLVGADNLAQLPHWHRYQDLLQLTRLWVYPRDGYEFPTHPPRNVTLLHNAPVINVSSTRIRRALLSGADTGDALPGKDWAYKLQKALASNGSCRCV